MYTLLKRLVKEFLIEDKNLDVQHHILTVPNIITFLGLIGIVFYVYQFVTGYYVILIPITVFIIGLSDLLDGFLARHLGQHSYLGKFLDPLRDKLLMLAVLGNILYLYHTNLWLFVPICIATFCECIVIAQNIWYLRKQVPSRVHFTGKIRMLLVLMCIFAILTQMYWLGTEFIPAAVFVWIIALLSAFRFLMKTCVLIKTYQQSRPLV